MRSSESTPNPGAEPRIPLYLWVAREDHPRACTGRRLLRFGRVAEVTVPPPGAGRTIVLDPRAPAPVGRYDTLRAQAGGVLAVDCSWNRLSQRGAYPPQARWIRSLRHRRRLPWLMATNPQHFGRVAELSTAEAFGATLWLLGQTVEARELLAGFAGGSSFFEVNESRLRAYAGATTPDELVHLEGEVF